MCPPMLYNKHYIAYTVHPTLYIHQHNLWSISYSNSPPLPTPDTKHYAYILLSLDPSLNSLCLHILSKSTCTKDLLVHVELCLNSFVLAFDFCFVI